ncbi:heat-inducible transcriptional repressor HrcA [Aerococcaceae bacterium NML201209]|nr:heat-inducible transcriptional repressor HrcA [Aerococcaceae bacterium NML201209]MCW6665355.1 heat-inducible transcriptional repressor HrcA [Aerococcaceae bacterium NML191219]MCW6676685.1 heat-inducible transcriptional repressor HrcA [Aerococcaceae bacterium NML180378]
MLTARQQQILHLIVQLYGQLEEPIGSKTLLQQSVLNVSSATVRNEMLALERQGYLTKAHTSSGRIPSFDAYRHYINELIHHENDALDKEDEMIFRELFRERQYDALQQAQMAADILAATTGHTAVVWAQNNDAHHVKEFRLIHLTDYSVIAVLLTDKGSVESQLFDLTIGISKDTIRKVADLINEEVKDLSLTEATQRMKLMVPLLLQRTISYRLDFLPLFEKMTHQLKGNHYIVSGKNNLFDMIDPNIGSHNYKQIFSFVDGSREMYQLLEAREPGLEVLFGVEMSPHALANINMIAGTYYQHHQKIVIGLIGPATMRYHRIIGLIGHIIQELSTE